MKRFLFSIALCLTTSFALGDSAAAIREVTLYINPDTSSAKLGTVARGRELAVIESSRDWLKVLAHVTAERTTTGWTQDKGIVRQSTPNGDQILFGEAVDSENEASRRYGRKGAADDARRLYYRVYDMFPKSPLAGEGAWRAADIQWQLDRADAMSRPSAKAADPSLKMQIEEDFMREVEKKFSGTRWADLAAFDMLDNKICGDWQGEPKCPEKETEVYQNYVKSHPQSPKAAEALYDAAYRQSALIEIYKQHDDRGKSDAARNKARSLAQRVISEYPNSTDWATRAQALLMKVEQGVPTYGNDNE